MCTLCIAFIATISSSVEFDLNIASNSCNIFCLFMLLLNIVLCVMFFLNLEHVGHGATMSVSRYGDPQFKPRLHQYFVSLSKTFNPHCFHRLWSEMSKGREHRREGCLFSGMSFSEEIALKNQRFIASSYLTDRTHYVSLCNH